MRLTQLNVIHESSKMAPQQSIKPNYISKYQRVYPKQDPVYTKNKIISICHLTGIC